MTTTKELYQELVKLDSLEDFNRKIDSDEKVAAYFENFKAVKLKAAPKLSKIAIFTVEVASVPLDLAWAFLSFVPVSLLVGQIILVLLPIILLSFAILSATFMHDKLQKKEKKLFSKIELRIKQNFVLKYYVNQENNLDYQDFLNNYKLKKAQYFKAFAHGGIFAAVFFVSYYWALSDLLFFIGEGALAATLANPASLFLFSASIFALGALVGYLCIQRYKVNGCNEKFAKKLDNNHLNLIPKASEVNQKAILAQITAPKADVVTANINLKVVPPRPIHARRRSSTISNSYRAQYDYGRRASAPTGPITAEYSSEQYRKAGRTQSAPHKL